MFGHLLEQEDALFYPYSFFGYFFLHKVMPFLLCCVLHVQVSDTQIGNLGSTKWVFSKLVYKLTKRI